jgi:uncharacterized membrane protein
MSQSIAFDNTAGNDALNVERSRVSSKIRAIASRLIIPLTLIVCIGGPIAISHFFLIKQSIELDEAQSLWQASHTIHGTLHYVALDVQLPFYMLILHFWMTLFGVSIYSARLLSLIFFLISIPVFYLLAKEVLNKKYSLLATVIFSYSPFMNWYANTARMYTFLSLFTIISLLFFVKIVKGENKWLAYGLSSVVGMYTHYFYAITLVCEGLFLLIFRKKLKPGSVRKLLYTALAVSIGFLPWLIYFMLHGLAAHTKPLLPLPSIVDFFNAYAQFLFGFQNVRINTVFLSAWPLAMLIGLLAVRKQQRFSMKIAFIATMAFMPTIIAFGLSYAFTPFFVSRYLISAVAPLIIFIIWLIQYYEKNLKRAIAVLGMTILALAFYFQSTTQYNGVASNYRAAADYISTHATANDVVAVSVPFTIYPFEYYYNGPADVQTLPLWNQKNGAIPAFNSKTLPQQVSKIDKNSKNLYLLLSSNQGYQSSVKNYFVHHFKNLYIHTYSSDLTLYVYKVGYYTVPPLGSKPTLTSNSANGGG